MPRTPLIPFAWPVVAVSGLLALACLASILFIGWLQADLTASLRTDTSRLRAAQQAQIHLREYRVHSVVLAASPNDDRRKQVADDRERFSTSLAALERTAAPEDRTDLEELATGWELYVKALSGGAAEPSFRSTAELADWADAHRVRALLEPCGRLVTRAGRRMDATAARSETQTRWAGVALLAVGVVGPLAGLVSGYGIARRLARRFQAQERELLRAEQLATVGRLAAGVAHEIRNPLTGIKMLVEAAVRTDSPSPLTPADLELIRDEIDRMERTAQGLLDYAKPDRPSRRTQDVRPTVARATELVAARAERAGVTVKLNAGDRPLTASVDPDQLVSLLSNLLINAVDATPPGGTVTVDAEGTGGGGVRVSVTDTGSGLPPELADTLFTPFATTKPGGTGLGLAVARRVAENHGGTLVTDGVPGGGARFTLTLPAPEVSRAQTAGG